MYHEFDESRRIHQPYIDSFQRSKLPQFRICSPRRRSELELALVEPKLRTDEH